LSALTQLSVRSLLKVPLKILTERFAKEFEGKHETCEGCGKPVCARGSRVGRVWVWVRRYATLVFGKVRRMMGNAERMGSTERKDGTKYLSTDGFESVGDEKKIKRQWTRIV
jgi:hypothetical protein